ncbi:hypothetical protein BC829DRAFT_248343 [Chytridium lagenaria]|nr:hypothetical protein BC829DRAFT_248343 [Chytridium lagenaria]
MYLRIPFIWFVASSFLAFSFYCSYSTKVEILLYLNSIVTTCTHSNCHENCHKLLTITEGRRGRTTMMDRQGTKKSVSREFMLRQSILIE